MHFFFRNPGSPSIHVSLPQHHQQTFQDDQWASPSRGWEWRRRDSRASQQPQPFNGGTAMVSWFRCYSHHSCKKQEQQHKLTFPTIIGKGWMSKNQNTMGARMWRSPAKTHACCRSFIDLGWRIVKDGWKGIDFLGFIDPFFQLLFQDFSRHDSEPLVTSLLDGKQNSCIEAFKNQYEVAKDMGTQVHFGKCFVFSLGPNCRFWTPFIR